MKTFEVTTGNKIQKTHKTSVEERNLQFLINEIRYWVSTKNGNFGYIKYRNRVMFVIENNTSEYTFFDSNDEVFKDEE